MPDQRKIDAERIARVCVDAIGGSVNVGVVDGIKLKSAFGRYKTDEQTQALVLERFAELLHAEHFTLAAKLADALTAKVGK